MDEKIKVYYPDTITDQPLAVDGNGNLVIGDTTGGVASPAEIKDLDLPPKAIARELIGNAINTRSKSILAEFQFTPSGAIQIGTYANGESGDIRISPNGIVARNLDGVQTFAIDGTTGDAFFLGTIGASAGSIGGFEIGESYIRDVDNTFGLASVITGGNDLRFWAGSTFDGRSTAPLRIYEDGSVVASNLSITGGSISGIAIDIGGSDSTSFHVDTSGAMWLGNSVFSGAPFRVSAAGYLDCVAASFGSSGQLDIDSSGNLETTASLIANSLWIKGTIVGFTMSGGINMDNNSLNNVNQVSGSAGNIDFNESGRIQCSTHFDPGDGGSFNLGGSSRYWGDVSYKTLTDRGCLGWFDEGVELQDGTIVSDIEALRSIKKDPEKLTIYGKPMLDYTSLPKVVYKPAQDHEGNLYERDPKTDQPLPIKEKIVVGRQGNKVLKREIITQPQDGAETTALISIMLGSIKELANKFDDLESKLALFTSLQGGSIKDEAYG